MDPASVFLLAKDTFEACAIDTPYILATQLLAHYVGASLTVPRLVCNRRWQMQPETALMHCTLAPGTAENFVG